jgi:hypothetical protein
MTEFNYVGDDLALGVAFDQLEVATQVQGGPNLEAFLGKVVSRTLGDRLGVDQDATSHWSKRGLVEIKGAVEELPCRDQRVECSMLQKIESELSLWEEEIPKVQGKRTDLLWPRWKGMVLESPNCTLSMVMAMDLMGV